VLWSVCRERCDDEVSTRSHSAGDAVRVFSLVVRIDEEVKGGAVVPNVDLAGEDQIEYILAHKVNLTCGVSEPFAKLIERSL
jgi:hypothetical protein